ncbi:hypothetical protein F4810DRAFT_653865 [Camillea tinctor]|nr:hypothetical protein F4810DRAFT_653865 [Camillea tinctor]
METPGSELPWKPLVGDVTAAAIAATIVTPSMVIIDRAVVENIVHKKPLISSLWARTKLAARHPLQLVICRPFAIMWMLYAATYGTASVSDTLARHWFKIAPETITFVATSAINVPLGVWKDVRYAQIYGNKPVKARETPLSTPGAINKLTATSQVPTVPLRGVPRAAALVFLIRDCFTIFGSVTLPPKVSGLIPDNLGSGRLSKETMSQLMVPVLSQLVASPIHLVGLDMVNRQEPRISLRNRVSHNQESLVPTTVMRSLRILPSFGLGIITNTEMRKFFHNNL